MLMVDVLPKKERTIVEKLLTVFPSVEVNKIRKNFTVLVDLNYSTNASSFKTTQEI